jgi:hypothetical protein
MPFTDEDFDRLDRTMADMQESIECLLSQALSKRYGERPRLFWHLLKDPKTVSPRELNDLLASAEDAGRITRAEASRVIWSHLVLRDATAVAPAYLVVEVERTVRVAHIRRVQKRAAIFRKVGLTVECAVAGLNIQRDALDVTERESIGRMIEQELDGEDPTAGAVDDPHSY